MSAPPPVSLGKPSLRYRLESYYSLIAPDAIAERAKWKKNFEIIYNKYGGTVEGETKLAAKLAKKYGCRVRLLVAPPHRSMQRQLKKIISNINDSASAERSKHAETYYDVDKGRRDSKVLAFTSARFDAIYALSASENAVIAENPTVFSGPAVKRIKLDNVSKFRIFLPECDPQGLEPASMNEKMPGSRAQNSDIASNTSVEHVKKIKMPMFLAMATRYESNNAGPMFLLYTIVANRQRARVMVRYVDCVRGTLTGYLIAFDKHFNMILKDVDEVYSGRVTRHSEAVNVAIGCHSTLKGSHQMGDVNSDCDDREEAPHGPSKAKLEFQRRSCYPPECNDGHGPSVKQRYFHQLMVRGDNVVMVWRAEAERSTHP